MTGDTANECLEYSFQNNQQLLLKILAQNQGVQQRSLRRQNVVLFKICKLDRKGQERRCRSRRHLDEVLAGRRGHAGIVAVSDSAAAARAQLAQVEPRWRTFCERHRQD